MKKIIFGKEIFKWISNIDSKPIKQYIVEVSNQGADIIVLDFDEKGHSTEANRLQFISFPIEILEINKDVSRWIYKVRVDKEIITGIPGEINLKIRKKIRPKPFTQKYGYKLRGYIMMVLHILEENYKKSD